MRQMRAVSFVNGEGIRLAGILHQGDGGGRRDVGVILLSPGIKSRVGPHRLYCSLATALAQRGLDVLRFDFQGLGDSEGIVSERLVADLYGTVQTGRYVGDTHAAIDFFRRSQGVEEVILAGLCGGAITAVLAADGRFDIAGIVGLGLPVSLDNARRDPVKTMSDGQLATIRAGYRRKLGDRSSWKRLLTLRTDFRLVVRAVTAGFRSPRRPAADTGHLNPRLAPSLRRVLAGGCPVLLLFAQSDRLLSEYREQFWPRHRHALERYADLLDLRVVAGANHVFTFREWQNEMLDQTLTWVTRALDDRAARLSDARTCGERVAY